MVNIAVAGGSGEVGREIIDALVAAHKHSITLLTRNASKLGEIPGVTFRTVNYDDKGLLVEALSGIHTVLSFVQLLSDPGNKTQKNLIDACVEAGVTRFAPSEWGSSRTDHMPWWSGKAEVTEYLKTLNSNGKVLEYTLFQPGLFLDYLAFPHKSAKHLSPLNTFIDIQHRRAIVVDGHEDAVMTLTTVRDLSAVVVRAVEYEGEWPEVGGITGNRVTVSRILEIGEKVRGRPFTVDGVKLEDLEKGELIASWGLETKHHAAGEEEAEGLLRMVMVGMLVSSIKGCWDGEGGWNARLPDFEFTKIEDFLAGVWEGKA